MAGVHHLFGQQEQKQKETKKSAAHTNREVGRARLEFPIETAVANRGESLGLTKRLHYARRTKW